MTPLERATYPWTAKLLLPMCDDDPGALTEAVFTGLRMAIEAIGEADGTAGPRVVGMPDRIAVTRALAARLEADDFARLRQQLAEAEIVVEIDDTLAAAAPCPEAEVLLLYASKSIGAAYVYGTFVPSPGMTRAWVDFVVFVVVSP